MLSGALLRFGFVSGVLSSHTSGAKHAFGRCCKVTSLEANGSLKGFVFLIGLCTVGFWGQVGVFFVFKALRLILSWLTTVMLQLKLRCGRHIEGNTCSTSSVCSRFDSGQNQFPLYISGHLFVAETGEIPALVLGKKLD